MTKHATLILWVFILFLSSCGTAPTGEPEPSEVSEEPRTESTQDSAETADPRQLEFERLLRGRIVTKNIEDSLKELTKAPHVAGGKRNAQLAQFLVNKLRGYGYQVERFKYHVLLPYPVDVQVEMIAPQAFSASLREEPLELDLDTHQPSIPPYNAYSPDCDLTAPVIYANYARREDFEKLESLGVSVRGKIVLARYGYIFRGSKAKIATEFGAAGLILYNDPADDGFARGDTYPHGRFRPESAVERGSILDITQYPGDPGTPGRASLPGTEQPTFDEMQSLPVLPTTCISHADARPLLENLDGAGVPKDWQGGVPVTYHLGNGGKTRVRLRLEMDYSLREIENITATMPGLRCPDEVIMIGNHRDAWVHGAIDPGSGTAVLLEAARVLADANAEGRGLDRTIRFAFWDAEEFGIIGSTEYGEQFADQLKKEVVAYINVDAAVSGPNLWAAGTPTLKNFAEGLFSSIPTADGQSNMAADMRGTDGKFKFGTLGSGSDYTVFLEHLGIDCLDFSSGGSTGVYHSSYDTYVFMKRFGDPGFVHHNKMAGILATMVDRMGRAFIAPLEHTKMAVYLNEVIARMEAKHSNLDLSELQELTDAMMDLGRNINKEIAALDQAKLSLENRLKINEQLTQASRKLLLENGLKDRPWYKHCLFAPHPDKGYGTEDLPPLTDALMKNDKAAAQDGAAELVTAIRNYMNALDALRIFLTNLNS